MEKSGMKTLLIHFMEKETKKLYNAFWQGKLTL